MTNNGNPGGKRVYSVAEWLRLPPETREALSRGGGEGLAFASLQGSSGRTTGGDYTAGDIAEVRRYLLHELGRDALNPLDRSAARITRVRKAVETWIRTPVNHAGRLAFSVALVDRMTADAVGLGVVERFLDDPAVTEVSVGRWNDISVEQAGRVLRLDPKRYSFTSPADLLTRIEFIAMWYGQSPSATESQMVIVLDDGTRITTDGPPACEGTMVIRRRSPTILSLEDLVRFGTLTPAMADILRLYVRAGVGVLVSGASGAGKTTLLEALVGALDETLKIVLIQESDELRPAAFRCLVIRKRAEQNAASGSSTSLEQLARGARLLGPNRVIIGEVKGREAAEMLIASKGGTGGPMCTLHATSAAAALDSLQGLCLLHDQYQGAGAAAVESLRRDIAQLFPVVVHMGVDERADKRQRYVTQILEVAGLAGMDWDLRVVAQGEAVAGNIEFTDVPEQVEHVAVVKAAVRSLPAEGAEAVARPELDTEKRGRAMDLLAQADQALSLDNVEGALALLDNAAELNPDNSVIITTRSDLRARAEQEKALWLDKFAALQGQVRFLMQGGADQRVRDLLPAIKQLPKMVAAVRDGLLAEITVWLEEREARWGGVPLAARQAVADGQGSLVLAWAEQFYRQCDDATLQILLTEADNLLPADVRPRLYRESVGADHGE